MSAPFAEKNFKSFDGSESSHGKLFAPDRYRLLESVFQEASAFSVQGAGLSFPALSFGKNAATLQLSHFNRFLAFDESRGVIEVESGMNLGTLALMTLPKGWYLKVQPGHPSITLGGCLATDVHGKNQFQDFNFKEQVLFLKLYHPEKGFVFCDRTENAELFHLTCGGWGLTGVVLSLGLQLGRIQSQHIETETLPIENLFELPALLKERSALDDLIYTWHDLNSSRRWGQGFLKAGRYRQYNTPEAQDVGLDVAAVGAADDVVGEEALRSLKKVQALTSEHRGRLPINLLSPLGTRCLNFAYSLKELRGPSPQTQSLVEFLFPVINKTIYYDLFGKKGFHETQVLIPFEQFAAVMKELQQGLKKHPVPITLASCKLFKGQPELLRFIGDGVVLALNFPRNADSAAFLEWWDALVVEARGLPNISKDSRLPLKVVEACYPQLNEFRSQLTQWDPQRVFQNSLSQRLQL